MFKRLIIALFLLIVPLFLTQAMAIKIPKEHIFKFERSTNSNYICYDINLQDNKLCQKEPLKAYWVLGEETRIEGLTFLDKKMAFGVKVLSAKEDEAIVHLTAYKNLNIRICKQDGKWVGIVKLHGHEMVLQKMYAKMKESLAVKCEYIDIIGTDIATGEKRSERITP
jgi:hypothetical protein